MEADIAAAGKVAQQHEQQAPPPPSLPPLTADLMLPLIPDVPGLAAPTAAAASTSPSSDPPPQETVLESPSPLTDATPAGGKMRCPSRLRRPRLLGVWVVPCQGEVTLQQGGS